MLETTQIRLKSALEVTSHAPTRTASNGIRYGSYGETLVAEMDLEQMVQAVPGAIAAALDRKAYYFVPLAMADTSEITSVVPTPDSLKIASDFSTELSEAAVCHRNADLGGVECVFISTRLMQDRFALAFEFYINAGHHFVDAAAVPESFTKLIWSQAEAGVRGETSQDAWDHRGRALWRAELETIGNHWGKTPQTRKRRTRVLQIDSSEVPPAARGVIDEKARTEYFHAAFADAIAIYLLSLTVDFDYMELREREYPLLAAPALAERLRHIAQLFPPNAGHEFSIRYRRRNS